MATQLDGIEVFFGLDIENYNPSIGIQDSRKALRITEVPIEPEKPVLKNKYTKPPEASLISKTFLGISKMFGNTPSKETNQKNEKAKHACFKDLFQDTKIHEIEALLVGCEDGGDVESLEEYISLIIENASKFKSLKAIYTGDIDQEQSEISWIVQFDHSNLLKAFPNLVELRIKGGNSLSIGEMNMKKLKKLVILSGGLDNEIIKGLIHSQLPALEHLELWLGTDEYGFFYSKNEIEELLNVYSNSNLKYLGLVNCDRQDEIIELIIENKIILQKLDKLDLSLGNMSDKGGALLLNCPEIQKLPMLEITHHYMSDEMVNSLKKINPSFIIDDRNESDAEDEDDRYVAVGE